MPTGRDRPSLERIGHGTGGRMSALPRPDLGAGPAKELSEALHALHHAAGWPSLRALAKELGCSHTTVSAAFSSPRVPRWGLVELLVEALGGDVARFHALWMAAGQQAGAPGATDGGSAGEPAVRGGPEPEPEPPPRQLPAEVFAFTGRAAALAALDRALLPESPTPAVPIALVCGTAGVGKTAVALRWAHRHAHRFPAGQLYLDLRGYDPDRPVGAAEALEVALRALGVSGQAMPAGTEERAARFRSLVAGRRLLLVLDNVHELDQVRLLLPGSSSCAVLITSRDTLPALVARHGAARVQLDLMSTEEALVLLRVLVGDRVDAEPAMAMAMARRCARLPLALRLAAELAAAQPSARLAELVAELGDRPLDLFEAGDDRHTAVRAVFSWSLGHLDLATERGFTLLGVHPGRAVDAHALAALAGTEVAAARRALAALTRAHLVSGAGPWFGLHDLLRSFAAERAAALPAADREAALGRLRAYLLDTAGRAVAVALPSAAAPGPPGPVGLDFAGPVAARTWLDAERESLVALAVALPEAAGDLGRVLAPYLDAGGHYADARTLDGLALRVAAGPAQRRAALTRLGDVHRRQADYAAAADHYRQALATAPAAGNGDAEDAAVTAAAGLGLGILAWRAGRYPEAEDLLTAALATAQECGDLGGAARACYNLGIVHRRLGRYPAALDHHQRALAAFQAAGDRTGEGRVRNNLGFAYLQLGRYEEALDQHSRSLAIQRQTADKVGQCVALINLGLTEERLDRPAAAAAHHEQALDLATATGYRAGAADALRGLGTALAALGRLEEALPRLREALTIAAEIGEADAAAGAHNDLGDVLRGAGRPGAAAAYAAALRLAEATGDGHQRVPRLQGAGTSPSRPADGRVRNGSGVGGLPP